MLGRVTSLALLILLAGALLAHPEWLGDGIGWTARIGLTLALVGGIGAVVHASGHPAERRLLQIVQAPRIAWPAIAGGLTLMLLERYL